jgi:hypothetical protein
MFMAKPNKQKKIKVTVAYYIENMGDGSATIRFFNNKDDAESYAEHDDERYCDDIDTVELIFDDKGKLLNPDKLPDWKLEMRRSRT